MRDLAGKVAAITGGASGIGLAMAQAFGREGMSVAIADIEEIPLANAQRVLADAGIDVSTHAVDVGSADQVSRWATQVVDRHGAVHVVCNNAGVGPLAGINEMSLDEFRWVMDTNLFGVLHGVKSFLPLLESQGEGHIVNVASVSGLFTQPGAAAYNMSKFGVVALSEVLHYELAMGSSPIGVSVVCPATVRTNIGASERNRPDHIEGSSGPIAAKMASAMAALTAASHRSAAEVAEAVLEAVKSQRFYVITHPGIMPFVAHRHEDIQMQRNPSVEQGF